MYEYQARVVRVVDADTASLLVDLGFDIQMTSIFRLFGINAPEQSTPEGKIATLWLKERLPVGTLVRIVTKKDHKEKFGRYLATIWLGDTNINQLLIETGHAVAYMT